MLLPFAHETWVTLTREEVVRLQIKQDGTSELFPNTQFLVRLQFVNAKRNFITDQPHKYPGERFTEEFKVYATTTKEEDPY